MTDKINDKVNGKLYEIINGWVRFRFTYAGERHTFHPHIPEVDIATANAIEQVIRNDIASGDFDWSFSRYRINSKQATTTTLWECWLLFLNEHDHGNNSNNTAKKRRLVTDILRVFEGDTRTLQTVFNALQTHCYANYSGAYARQILSQIKLAVRVVEHIELEIVATEKPKKGDTLIDVFPAKELRSLLNHVRESDLTDDEKGFIFCLAYTGMRPGEVAGLDVQHFNDEDNLLSISQSWDGKSIKPTKTLKNRMIKVNSILTKFLIKQCEGKTVNTPMFQGRKSYRFPYSEFARSIWKPLLADALECGLVHHYRNPYQLRHTFASIALAKGESLEQVAAHLGNSPSVCRRHYAGYQPSGISLVL